MVDAVLFSSNTGVWATPQKFYDDYNAEWCFDLDAAADKNNHKCDRWLGPDSDICEDALSLHEWPGKNIWLNPPYGRELYAWIEKAYRQSALGKNIVLLLPARTDTRWFHEFCVGAETTFIKGRLHFGGSKDAAPFPSMVVVFRAKEVKPLTQHAPGDALLVTGDCREQLKLLPSESVQCVVTSPPYLGLRKYTESGIGEIGQEDLDDYVQTLVEVFREVRRILKPTGTLWLNLGDSFAGNSSGGTKTQGNPEFNKNRPSREATLLPAKSIPSGLKAKDLIGVPWRVALALQKDGWYLRSDIIWHKPNPMPESVKDRPTKSHEYLFLLTKSENYFYDADAIREPHVDDWHKRANTWRDGNAKQQQRGDSYHAFKDKKPFQNPPNPLGRNSRSVWTLSTKPYKEAHFAVMPPDLAEKCVTAGSRPGDVVLDPFSGAATTGVVATKNGRKYVGIDLNPDYVKLSIKRLREAGISVSTYVAKI